MSLDFQQIQRQVMEIGEFAPERERQLRDLQRKSQSLLDQHAGNLEALQARIARIARQAPTLRCARPAREPLNACYPQPELPKHGVILAADGSQIAPDRHGAIDYYLINVGVIQLQLGSCAAPVTVTRSRLYFGADLETRTGTITEGQVTLERDLAERVVLAELAPTGDVPAIALIDGPLELWGAKGGFGGERGAFQESLERYKGALDRLCQRGATAAGYVDGPRADLLVRLLEIASLPEADLGQAGRTRPLLGVSDLDLLRQRLKPGERSAVFGLQSQSVEDYTGNLALHFFYLNVGTEDRPWLARVEVPAWVAGETGRLDGLQAVLVDQCRTMGNRPYPYLLHRAHETAVVSLDEKEQVAQMIALELRRQGVTVGAMTHKQAAKDLSGKKRHSL